jgi:hypothetical protein
MGEPTRGTWAVTDLPDVGCVAVESEHGHDDVNDGWIICACEGPDARANAHLIAAAPDLFDVLRALIEAFDTGNLEMNSPEIGGHDDIPLHPWHMQWLHLARAALLKASPGGTKDAG